MHGIVARRKRRYFPTTTQRLAGVIPAPNRLNQDFTASAPNRKWVSDFTYIETAQGWLYLAVVLDLYSRRVIGWAMSDRINGALVLAALTMALEQRRPEPGLIHHSDQGMQYAGGDYRALLHAHGLRVSMSRKGNCYDNAPVESFFSTLKNEWTWHHTFQDRDQARAALFDYIELFYNRQRRHAALDYQSPVQFEEHGVS